MHSFIFGIDKVSVHMKRFTRTYFRKLDIQIKLHIIRRLLRDRFRRRYKKGPGRPQKLDCRRSMWTNAFFWSKFISILPSLRMIINIDGWCFSRSIKQSYSWLAFWLPSWIHNAKWGGSMALLSAISSDGTSFTAMYRWTVNGKVFIKFLESLFQYIHKKGKEILSNSLIIMDNCPYQKSESVKELMKNWNANWIYFPPYSPELAPIELLFRSLKAKIRVCSGEEEVYFSSQHEVDPICKVLRQVKPKEIVNYWIQIFIQVKSIIRFIYQNK